MALELQILRTAKAALEEGLLGPADYESMKASFIKAQSIKAGVEAGFISESDYSEARLAFFSGLGMSVGGPVAANRSAQVAQASVPASGPNNGAPPKVSKPAPIQTSFTSSAPAARAVPVAAVAPSAPAPSSEAAPVPKAPEWNDVPPLSLPDAQTQPEGNSSPTTGGSRSASLLPTPTGLSDRGGKSVSDKVRSPGHSGDA